MSERPIHAADAGAPFARAASHLRAALSRAELWPGLARRRASLEAGVEAMERARSNLHGSLWILVLGGTGVGKSTLLGALAGREIAPASVRRPTTTRTTFYAHREAGLSPLGDIPAGEGTLVAHEIEALRDKVVIDPPDFDSSVESNRRRLVPLVGASDLIVTVVDREKYRDEALYEIMARFHGEKTFLFVMNKLDLGCPEDVLDDFRSALEDAGVARPRMLTISARAALEARVAGVGPSEAAGDFAELERIVAEELDRARIREIKRTNLAGLSAHVLEGFDEAVGPGARGRLEDSLGKCRRLAESLTDGLRAIFSRVSLGAGRNPRTDALRNYLRGLQLFSFGGVFGLYLAVAERLRSLLERAWQRPLDRIEARGLAEARVRSVGEGEVGSTLAGATAEAVARFASAGLSAEVVRARLDPARSGLAPAGLVRDAAEGAADALEALTDAALSGGRLSFRNVLHNLVPTLLLFGIPAYSVYAVISDDAFLGSPADALALGGIGVIVVCWLQGLLVERSLGRGGARALLDVESGLATRIGGFVREHFLGTCERLADEAGAVLEEIENAREVSGGEPQEARKSGRLKAETDS